MMRNKITVTIPGAPVAKGRPRFTRRGVVFTPKKTRNWESAARQHAEIAMFGLEPLTGALSLRVEVAMPTPASWPLWKRDAASQGIIVPTSKPDLDNFIKSVKDALNGIVWIDDSQVVLSTEEKRYGADAGVVVTATRLTDKLPSQIASKSEFDLLTMSAATQ